ncbi:MAG: hypothetical protein IKF90_19785 [Parasporobacterium sp.]|nr:hypothetical protein [Parasporobacterium sp.]
MIIGANLGGLGTLISSAASLASFKAFAHACKKRKIFSGFHPDECNLSGNTAGILCDHKISAKLR